MPLYLYQGLKTAQVYELQHSMLAGPIGVHPDNGEPLRRIYTSPHLGCGHSSSQSQKLLDNPCLEKNGFSKYERLRPGLYHRTVGSRGPLYLKP